MHEALKFGATHVGNSGDIIMFQLALFYTSSKIADQRK
jgi:hypothetical protein